MASSPSISRKSSRRGLWRRVLIWCAAVAAAAWCFLALLLVSLRWIDPPTTVLQSERQVQSWFHKGPYQKRYHFVPLAQISPDFQHAVISAEDARFYQHHGFDWEAIQKAAKEDMEGQRLRGGSTLTQQLVKNLFFGTNRSIVRKGLEASLVPVAEFALGKQRILELYMNVVEWGPGVYGADAAAHYWYRTSARGIRREQGARLAAILPSPLRRHPDRMDNYSAIVLRRMAQVGW